MNEPRPVDLEESHAILEPYFIAARDIFLEYCVSVGLDEKVKKTAFECSTEMHDTARHYAGASLDGRKILVAPQMADLPEDTVAAILAHEFGHVVDHLYPAQFVLVEEQLVFVGGVPGEDKRSDQTRIARMRQWAARSDHEVELVADLLAEQATGCRIGYSGPCMLQGLNRGRPRPQEVT